MARIDKCRGKQATKEFIRDFCETGMNSHTKQISKAFNEKDWITLRDLSMYYERDCYSVGAIEIVGKLIKLRLLLQDEPISINIIESTLVNILEQSEKAQEYLINSLQRSDSSMILGDIKYIQMLKNVGIDTKQNWYYSNCLIQ